jgi:hypothetical protein
LKEAVAYATVKRAIQLLLSERLIEAIGKGKATRYVVSKAFELIHPINVEQYFQKEIDERQIKTQFNHSLITETLGTYLSLRKKN